MLRGGRASDIERGGRGNDRLYARDNASDVVRGGRGYDRAWVTKNDRVYGVEEVHVV